jgi:hypothetical protein
MESEKEKKIVIVQPYVINSLIQKFYKDIIEKKIYKTPGTPRFKIQ